MWYRSGFFFVYLINKLFQVIFILFLSFHKPQGWLSRGIEGFDNKAQIQ